MPVTAAVDLEPGEHIGFVGKIRDVVGRLGEKVGIVDPFLAKVVMGQPTVATRQEKINLLAEWLSNSNNQPYEAEDENGVFQWYMEAEYKYTVDQLLVLLKQKEVKQGQRFLMCMYPGTITSLRHVWTHPAIKYPTSLTEENR